MKRILFIIILISSQILAVTDDFDIDDDDLEDGYSSDYYFNQPHYSTSINYINPQGELVFVLINHRGNVYGGVSFAYGNLSYGDYSSETGASFNDWIVENWSTVNWFIIDQMG